MATIKHTHKLRRHTYKATGNSVFFCTLTDCSYKIETQFSLGKETLCNRCGQPFIMTNYAVRLAKPHCMSCHRSVASNQGVELVSTKIIDSLLPEVTDRREIATRRSDELVIRSDEPLEAMRERMEAPKVSYREIQIEDEDPQL